VGVSVAGDLPGMFNLPRIHPFGEWASALVEVRIGAQGVDHERPVTGTHYANSGARQDDRCRSNIKLAIVPFPSLSLKISSQ
jgi:hypothetical protein